MELSFKLVGQGFRFIGTRKAAAEEWELASPFCIFHSIFTVQGFQHISRLFFPPLLQLSGY
jgi:hypothetical protein